MTQFVERWWKHADRFSLLLAFFFLVLIALFVYIARIDTEIKQYDAYHHQLDRMRLLDNNLDGFFSQTYRYIDYDETTRIEHDFESILTRLMRRDTRQEFGQDIDHQVREIATLYDRKKEALEDFKSLNAQVTHSTYFLFDLRKSMEQPTLDKDPEKKTLIDDIFFAISQILMDLPCDRAALQKNLDKLSRYVDTDKALYAFWQHGTSFLQNTEQIKAIQHRAHAIPLRAHIDTILDALLKQYNTNRHRQKIISISLFNFAFVLLALLILSYRRIQANNRELQAFRYAIENSDNAIILTSPDRKIVYVNDAFVQRSGYSREEVMGRNPNIMKSDILSSEFYRQMNQTLDRGEIWQGELINRRKDGSLLYEKVSIIPIRIDDKLVQYLAVKLDITEYKEQQIQLKQAAAVYAMTGDGIIITDKNKRILSVNPAFEEMFGYRQDELVGEDPMLIQALKEESYFYHQMWETLLTKERWAGKIHNRTKDGTILPIWLTLALVRDENGEIENFIAIYTNLQEIIAIQERAEHLAYHDSLTGLPNRAHFDLRINDILELAKNTGQQVAVLFLDLDRFKVINDTLGHAIGDGMLVTIAKRLEQLVDKNVLFARLGGDEFVITLLAKHAREAAEKIAQEILSVIAEPIQVKDYYLNTTASIGIALFPDDATEKDQIIRYADSAMYAAKENGKGTYCFYNNQLSLDVQARLTLEQELQQAIESNSFYLVFQPQYDLVTRQPTGVEALLRWQDDILKDVTLDRFITIAEETGAIVKIGYFVFEEACRAYMRWKKMGFSFQSIAVNVSSVQFSDKHFIPTLREILARTGMPPEALEIEITERFIMEYSTSNMTVLDELRTLGCLISIDDFGTGYSSMSYMKRLPLDIIKIDRSFIMDIPDSVHDMEVSKAIIALAHSLGYTVIAEGIETPEQEAFLQKHHCDMGQGFYYARPMIEADLVRFLEEAFPLPIGA